MIGMSQVLDDYQASSWEALAELGKALASPQRVALLLALQQSPKTVESLAAAMGTSAAAVSHHLQLLRRARLITARRDGKYVWYAREPRADALLNGLLDAGSVLSAQLQKAAGEFFESDGFPSVPPARVLRETRAGEALVVDVRPAAEYAAGRFPGAISAPLAAITSVMARLPLNATIYVYGRGRFCPLSELAKRTLRAAGFQAVRLPSGVLEFRLAGIDLEPVSE
jgi:DNA-binding transcriptional ArsR family regulator/rhodanese-related sulfurtransferase